MGKGVGENEYHFVTDSEMPWFPGLHEGSGNLSILDVEAAGILFPFFLLGCQEPTPTPPCSASPSAAGFPCSPFSASPLTPAGRRAPALPEGLGVPGDTPLVQSPCVSWSGFQRVAEPPTRCACERDDFQMTCVQVTDFKSFQ